MIPNAFSDIDTADLEQLRADGVPEGKTLEYKRDLPGATDEDKREFLADLSSFANTDGGDLIYGVSENEGVIKDFVGIRPTDPDAEVLRLQNLLRDGIAPRLTADMQLVGPDSCRVLVIRVQRSWAGPHRVIFRGHDKFYGRTTAGKFPLDVAQLRTAFLQQASITEKLHGFRLDRIIEIVNDRAPVPLVQDPTVVLHVLPFGDLIDDPRIDVTIFSRQPGHRPLGANGWACRMTFDGLMLHQPADDTGRVASYTHFFRNGVLEAVATNLLETRQVSGQRLIPHVVFEQTLLNYLPSCFAALKTEGVCPPVLLTLSLLRVRGLSMALGGFTFEPTAPIREDLLLIPGMVVESFATPAGPLLKPMFDRVWNACGLLQSRNFDEQGTWTRR